MVLPIYNIQTSLKSFVLSSSKSFSWFLFSISAVVQNLCEWSVWQVQYVVDGLQVV